MADPSIRGPNTNLVFNTMGFVLARIIGTLCSVISRALNRAECTVYKDGHSSELVRVDLPARNQTIIPVDQLEPLFQRINRIPHRISERLAVNATWPLVGYAFIKCKERRSFDGLTTYSSLSRCRMAYKHPTIRASRPKTFKKSSSFFTCH
eukprot:Lithocolla_globosa_v1_NODE_6447_length_1086_cov_37.549952.p2 type:complete len:151 gc:universal NODE_6447_length_1086_cov_37.549952:548-96(-)